MAANTTINKVCSYNEMLLSIQKQYLQMVPLRNFDWKNTVQFLDIALQKAILKKTYMNKLFIHYTPSIKYKRMFLKHLMKMSEEANLELADEVYECYAEVVSKVEDDQSCCYKTYMLPSGYGITLEESQSIISQGTTGLSTWQAALYMLEWALENCNLFQNSNVLELGCGLGLLGLSICSSCSPQHYIFTDCHEAVLGSLNKNLSINGFTRSAAKCLCETNHTTNKTGDGRTTIASKCPYVNRNNISDSRWSFGLVPNNPESVSACSGNNVQSRDSVGEEKTVFQSHSLKDCCKDYTIGTTELSEENVELMNNMGKIHLGKQHGEGCSCDKNEVPVTWSESISRSLVNVASVKLDWENVSVEDLERLSCGIILATDVIYDVDLIKSFVPVVFQLLSCHGDGSTKPVAFVSSTVRNPETFQCFLQELDDCHIKWTMIDKPLRKLFFYDDSSDIRLMKLEL